MNETKLQKLLKIMSNGVTPARALTEITEGWSWGGRSATTKQQRRGLKRFASSIRRMNLEPTLWRMFSGQKTIPLPLP